MARWMWTLLGGGVILAAVAAATIWLFHRAGRADLSYGSIPTTLIIESASFLGGGQLPRKLSCDGANLSPAVKIPLVPPATKSLAVVMDDIDAPFGFVHWLAYDIPPSVRDIGEGASPNAQLPPNSAEGMNDFARTRYDGPCPPSGRHRYRLSVYAIDVDPGLPAGETKKKLADAVGGHILAWGEMFGFYGRAGR